MILNNLYSIILTGCSKRPYDTVLVNMLQLILYISYLGKKSLGVNKMGSGKKKKTLNTNTSNNLELILFIFFLSNMFSNYQLS